MRITRRAATAAMTASLLAAIIVFEARAQPPTEAAATKQSLREAPALPDVREGDGDANSVL